MDMIQTEPVPRFNGKGLKYIAIGFLFFILNIEINQVDLTPDFIGYLFIFYGSTQLQSFSVYFQKIRWVEVVLLCNSFLSIYNFSYPIDSVPTPFLIYSITKSLVLLPVHILFYVYLIRGICQIASVCGAAKYALWGKRMMVCLVSVKCLGTAMNLLPFFMGDILGFIFVVMMVLNIVVSSAFAVFLWKAYFAFNGHQLAEQPPALPQNAKSVKPFMIVCALVTAAVFAGNVFFYVNSKYLFTRSEFPVILTETLDLDYATFKKPVSIDCTKTSEKGVKRMTVMDQSQLEPTVKELLGILASGLEQAQRAAVDDNDMYRFSCYNLNINSQQSQLRTRIIEEQNVIKLDRIYYTLQEEDMRELVEFLENHLQPSMDNTYYMPQ